MALIREITVNCTPNHPYGSDAFWHKLAARRDLRPGSIVLLDVVHDDEDEIDGDGYCLNCHHDPETMTPRTSNPGHARPPASSTTTVRERPPSANPAAAGERP